MTFGKVRLAPALGLGAVIVALGALGPVGAPGLKAAAQPAAQVHLAAAPAIDRSQQRTHCDAQLRAIKQASGLADGQSDQDFMKTCLADVDPVATLPGSAAVINAPVGSTGVCKDGTYASAVRSEGACGAHGGVARWFGR